MATHTGDKLVVRRFPPYASHADPLADVVDVHFPTPEEIRHAVQVCLRNGGGNKANPALLIIARRKRV